MPFAITDPPAYVLDQVFGYQSVNNLFTNDGQIKGSIDAEHDFVTGIHTTARVAWIEGNILYSAGYSIGRGTNISSVDVSGLSTGQCRVNFGVTFAAQDWGTFITVEATNGGEDGGWQWDGNSKTSILVNLVDENNAAADMDFNIAAFGTIV